MARFLCLQRSLPKPETGEPSSPPSPAQMQAMYAKFDAWRQQFAEHLVDPGGKLGGGKVVADASADGPFAEVKELVGGYMIVEAATLDEAIEVARACPGLVRPGSGVEVIEIQTP